MIGYLKNLVGERACIIFFCDKCQWGYLMLHSFILFICFGDDIVMVVAIKKIHFLIHQMWCKIWMINSHLTFNLKKKKFKEKEKLKLISSCIGKSYG